MLPDMMPPLDEIPHGSASNPNHEEGMPFRSQSSSTRRHRPSPLQLIGNTSPPPRSRSGRSPPTSARERSPARSYREISPTRSPRGKSPARSSKAGSAASRSPSPRSKSPFRNGTGNLRYRTLNPRTRGPGGQRQIYTSKLTSPIDDHYEQAGADCSQNVIHALPDLSQQDLSLLSIASIEQKNAFKGRRYSVQCEGRRSPTERSRLNSIRRRASNEAKIGGCQSSAVMRCASDGHETLDSPKLSSSFEPNASSHSDQIRPLLLTRWRSDASMKLSCKGFEGLGENLPKSRSILLFSPWEGDAVDKMMMLFCVLATLITSVGILLLEPVGRMTEMR